MYWEQYAMVVFERRNVVWFFMSDFFFYCRYDILVGRSPLIGNATRVSFQSHVSLVDDLKPGLMFWRTSEIYMIKSTLASHCWFLFHAVISCGWLPPPANGKKQGTTYLQWAKVKFSCNDGYKLSGSEERTCQSNGKWSGEDASCSVPSTKSQ